MVRNTMTKFVALCPTLLVLCLGGCASMSTSIGDLIVENIECHNKCPGGSPEAERKCYDKCRSERARLMEREKERERMKSVVGHTFPP